MLKGKYIVKDDGGYDKWIFTETERHNGHDGDPIIVDFEVELVTSWDPDTHAPLDSENVLEANLKWDGCSNLRFGEKNEDGTRDGYLHLHEGEYKEMMDQLWEIHQEIIR